MHANESVGEDRTSYRYGLRVILASRIATFLIRLRNYRDHDQDTLRPCALCAAANEHLTYTTRTRLP